VNTILQTVYKDSLGVEKKLVHEGRWGSGCVFAAVIRPLWWIVFTNKELFTAYKASIYSQGIDWNDEMDATMCRNWKVVFNRGITYGYAMLLFVESIRGEVPNR
jgi:hypothetical protein